MTLAVVTATIDYPRAKAVISGWFEQAAASFSTYIVGQTGFPLGWNRPADELHLYGSPVILGVVPAFAIGVQKALEDGADIIACLHDDLEIQHEGWDDIIRFAFEQGINDRIGLVGFGGATGLGSDDLYRLPYHPMQLARQDFCSNMRDAEAHGRRSTVTERVACLDGFSQIGRREFWLGAHAAVVRRDDTGTLRRLLPEMDAASNLFTLMQEWGVVHHFYDGMLGAFARRLGWEVWMLPIQCHHHGGLTAVADTRYTTWANTQLTCDDFTQTKHVQGDAAFWTQAHRIGYDQFRDVLPIRL